MASEITIHASCVEIDGRGVLIRGKSGSGKSALALQLLAFGGRLVADDQVVLTRTTDLQATSPETLKGMIEARHFGILTTDTVDMAPVACVVDLDQEETERVPPKRLITLMGMDVALFYKVEGIHFAPAIVQFLRHGPASL